MTFRPDVIDARRERAGGTAARTQAGMAPLSRWMEP